LICLRREPEHISIRSDRRVGCQGNLVFADVPFVIGLAGPGIKNAAMLSDVDAAVTSQAGVLDLPFWICRLSKAGLPGHVGMASSRPSGSRATDVIDFARPAVRDSAAFRPRCGHCGVCHEPIRPPQAILRQADFKAIA
jgi:hypothetical protein